MLSLLRLLEASNRILRSFGKSWSKRWRRCGGNVVPHTEAGDEPGQGPNVIAGRAFHRNGVDSETRTLFLRAASLSAVRSLFWLMMLAVHTPAFIASIRHVLDGRGSLIAPALYGLALSFFVLKIINVPFLRWHVTLRSCVAWFAIVALVHVDVVQPDRPIVAPECITIVALTCLIPCVIRASRKFVQQLNSGSRVQQQFACGLTSANTLWQDAFRPHCWLLVLGIRRLRAPPFATV